MDKFKRFLKKIPLWAVLTIATLVAVGVFIGFNTLVGVISAGFVAAILLRSYLTNVKDESDLAAQQAENTRIEQLCFFFRAISYEFIRRDEIALMFCLLKLSNIDFIRINRIGSYNSCPVYRFSFPRPYNAPQLSEEDHLEFGNTFQQYVTSQLLNSPYAPQPNFYRNTPVLQLVSVDSNVHHVIVDVAVMHNGKCWEDYMKAQNSPAPAQNTDATDWAF